MLSVYPHMCVCVCAGGSDVWTLLTVAGSCWAVHMFGTFHSRHYENVQNGAHTMTAICLSLLSDDKRRSVTETIHL